MCMHGLNKKYTLNHYKMGIQNNTLDAFCGSTFWDSSKTWYTTNPDFTICFEKTVMTWIPCAFIWTFAIFELYFIKNSQDQDIPWNWKNYLKMSGTILICLTSCCDIVLSSLNGFKPAVDIVTPVVKFLTFVLVGTISYYNKKYGIQSSALLFLFWFISTVCGTFQFTTYLKEVWRKDPITVPPSYYSYLMYYPLTVVMLFLNFFGEGTPRICGYLQLKRKSPEYSASFPARLTYLYFDPMMYKGFKKPLEENDMWEMKPSDSAAHIVSNFERYFKKTLRRAQKQNKLNQEKVLYRTDSERLRFYQHPVKVEASVLPAIWNNVKVPFLIATFIKVLHDIIQFGNPQILGLLISFVGSNELPWKGVVYATLLFIIASSQTFLINQHYDKLFVVALKTRAALTATIYRKTLKISNTARKEKTAGEIVNLMAVDAQKFLELISFINLIWSAPLQIVLSVYFLWQELGPSILAGLAVMVVLIPINGGIVAKSKKLHAKQMRDKDERVKLMNEILGGIKILKLYAWEQSFEKQITKIRTKEVKTLRQAAYLHAITVFIWNCAPFMVSCVAFTTYVMLDENNVLDTSKAFVSLALFNILRMPLNSLPNVITQIAQTWVSVKRINNFLNSEELDENSIEHNAKEDDPIIIKDATFTWGDKPILKNISINFPKNSLTAIVGSVGSGKSSFISGILGEMVKISGTVNTNGSIAYVPQQAWIQNATLKDNILFGKELDEQRYNRVIEACALEPDFEILANGDQTEIGEKGINLSGGQKQRISLARAVYADTHIYLLDDPMSAVDAHVGKHIFEHLLGPSGLLQNKTKILVTHGLTYLPQTDKIIVLCKGQVSEVGTYKELLNKRGAFAEFLFQHINEEVEDESELDELQNLTKDSSIGEDLKQTITRQRSRISSSYSDKALSELSYKTKSLESLRSAKSFRKASYNTIRSKLYMEPGKLIEEEKIERGIVKWSVYSFYLGALGSSIILTTILFNSGFQGFGIASNIWLGLWSEDVGIVVDGKVNSDKQSIYLTIYAVLGVGQAISILLSNIFFAKATTNAAQKLHDFVLHNVLRLPSSFFDITPAGRVLARFSNDIVGVDLRLPQNFNSFFLNSVKIVGTMIVISYTAPVFIAAVVPIGILYFFMQRYYVATSRQLKRLESKTRSPIYSHFGETISGAHVIRAYGQEERFVQESERKIDLNQMCIYPSNCAQRWLAVRLEMLGNCIILFTALFAVIKRDLTPALVGLSVSYSLQITQSLNLLVRMISDVETNIVCVERIKEYGELEREASWDNPTENIPSNWPDNGNIEFQNYQLRYRPGLDLVLKGLHFHVKGGEKIGIVGRTGAGKSSLTLALFRLIEASEGSIFIDGINIANIGLHSLRSRLTIIPQDAILFSGSLRINLDPFSKHSDEEIWRVLKLAHLGEFAEGLPAGLNHKITEGGENLSVGQRQLICLTRALLRKTKILILDEATAAVDLETDDLIQKTIRTEFASSTVLTIAHRLNTVMDCDRVMVLDKGRIAEFNSPQILLKQRSGIFYGMCKDAGITS